MSKHRRNLAVHCFYSNRRALTSCEREAQVRRSPCVLLVVEEIPPHFLPSFSRDFLRASGSSWRAEARPCSRESKPRNISARDATGLNAALEHRHGLVGTF